jgi:hypothetical protein
MLSIAASSAIIPVNHTPVNHTPVNHTPVNHTTRPMVASGKSGRSTTGRLPAHRGREFLRHNFRSSDINQLTDPQTQINRRRSGPRRGDDPGLSAPPRVEVI